MLAKPRKSRLSSWLQGHLGPVTAGCFRELCQAGSPEAALKLSRMQTLKEHLELALEQSLVHLQSVGTDRQTRKRRRS